MESPASAAFAKLVPVNAAAKLTFHAMYESSLDENVPQPEIPGLYIQPQQQYDKGVLLRRLQEKKGLTDSDSESLTDPDTDTENTTIGMRGRKNIRIDFLIPEIPASSGVRRYQVRFNLHQRTGYLFISKTSSALSAEVTVNGKAVRSGEQSSLNQTSMNIRINRLEFEFQYTDIAYTGKYYGDRKGRTFRCFGEWTISNFLGKGAYGRVSSATNSKGEVVAIKVVERDERKAEQIDHEIRVLKSLQELSEINEGDKNRIVRLKDTVYSSGNASSRPTTVEEVALILEPTVSATLSDLINPISGKRQVSLTKTVRLNFDWPCIANLFYDALIGLNFLHSNNWVHGDIKPGNIRILDGNTPRVVLLDFGGAVHLTPERQLPATPGRGGTVNYLAPERELQNHDHSIDVWSMGIIGFELLYGYRPWKIAVNPWRPTFHDGYRQSVEQMEKHNNTEFNELLLEMLRHPWADRNNGRRITTRDALKHACWQGREEDEPLVKKKRL
ncbi:hypothetical protein McaMca56_000027 [Microsporum canis]